MKNILLIAALSFVSSGVQAATIAAGQFTTPARITTVELHANAAYRFTTDTTDNTSAICSSANGKFWWPASDVFAKDTYSTVLAAYTAGKKVSVVYTDECNIAAKRLTHIIVSE